MSLNLDYVAVLVLSLLVEIPVFWLVAQRMKALPFRKMSPLALIGLLTLVSVCVHPLVFFGFMASGRTYLGSVLFGELFAVLAKTGLVSWSARWPFHWVLVPTAMATLFAWQLTPILSFWLYY